MKQLATALNFTQAAALLGHKRKQPEPQTFKLTRCHDGVFRVLIEAPKFRSGGVHSSTAEFIHNAKQSDWDAYKDSLYEKMMKKPARNGK